MTKPNALTPSILLKILIFLFIYSSTASAAPTVSIDTKHYSVYGSTANALRKDMTAKSPIRPHDAYTSWFVGWRFNWNTSNGQCYITNVTSTVDVKFTFPKWTNRNNSNYKLKSKWDRYYKALIAHENEHKNFGINAAKEIERKILKLSSSSTCLALEQRADSLGNNILDKYYALEKKYDRNTRHGMNNGAIFR